jgi:putative tricarboxylic transport membrane protein
MLEDTTSLSLTYAPGGIGALVYSTMAAQRSASETSLVAFSSGSLLNIAQGKFGPHTEGDVRWVAVVGTDYGVIAVRKDSPLRSLADLVKALKTDPRSVSFGAGGTLGSQDWFKAALLARAAGVSHKAIRFVAFEGGGDALSALEGGHLSVFAGDAAQVSQRLANNGSVRVLAVLADQRLPGVYAHVPTAKEQGIDLSWPIARGFYVGAKVSDAAFREWSEAFRRAMLKGDFARIQADHGLYPLSLVGDDLQLFIRRSMDQYRRLAADFELPKR